MRGDNSLCAILIDSLNPLCLEFTFFPRGDAVGPCDIPGAGQFPVTDSHGKEICMRALQLPRTLALTFVIVPAIMALQPTHLQAEQAQTGKYVYVMTNKTPHNSVIQYLRAGDGQL